MLWQLCDKSAFLPVQLAFAGYSANNTIAAFNLIKNYDSNNLYTTADAMVGEIQQ